MIYKEFKNKIVLVTGSSRGIGKQIASDFKKCGATVIKISSKDYDLSDMDSIKKLIKYIKSKKKIDILINNAGINFNEGKNFELNNFQKLISVNLLAPILISEQVSKLMKKNKFGRIINISSILSKRARSNKLSYIVSKSGIDGLTKSLSIDLAKHNILVNSISPGFINTEMTNQNLTVKQKKNILKKIPLNKFGETKDISSAVLFLSSEKNRYITGKDIIVDGGFLESIDIK